MSEQTVKFEYSGFQIAVTGSNATRLRDNIMRLLHNRDLASERLRVARVLLDKQLALLERKARGQGLASLNSEESSLLAELRKEFAERV